MPEIIPITRLKLISWEGEEDFLVAKRVRNKIILIGLREYLRTPGANRKAEKL